MLNDNLTTAIIEPAAAVEQVANRKQTGKPTQKTNQLIAKRKNMKLASTSDQIELARAVEID